MTVSKINLEIWGKKCIYMQWKPLQVHFAIHEHLLLADKVLSHLGKAGVQSETGHMSMSHLWRGYSNIFLFFLFISTMTLGIRPQSQKKWNMADSVLQLRNFNPAEDRPERAMYGFILCPPSEKFQSHGMESTCK